MVGSTILLFYSPMLLGQALSSISPLRLYSSITATCLCEKSECVHQLARNLWQAMTIVFVVYISCDLYLFHIHPFLWAWPNTVRACVCYLLVFISSVERKSSLTVTQHPRMKKGNSQPGPRMLRVRTAIKLLLLEKTHPYCHGNKELDIANNYPTYRTSPR